MIRNQQPDVRVDSQNAPMEEGAIIAAITTALFEMTEGSMQKVKRHHSPWNSKIYGLRHAISYNRLLRPSQ